MLAEEIQSFLFKEDKKSWQLINQDIGYIYPGTLSREEIPEMMEQLSKTKGIVIDLRCYPTDFLVYKLGQYLLPKRTDFAKFTIPDYNHPGNFIFSDIFFNGSVNPDYYKGKVIILINEQTQSSAEYTTMALRNAPEATVIGSTTAGADGNVSKIVLPGGIRTMFSGIGVYYPDGRETQRVGIIPDVWKEPTIQGIKGGKDEVLQLALEICQK